MTSKDIYTELNAFMGRMRDGNSIEAPTVPINLPRPMMHFGLSLKLYLARRPPHTASPVTAGNCCDTAYCNTHP